MSDGGTLWVDPYVPSNGNKRKRKESLSDDSIPQVIRDYGKFAYLEGKHSML